MSFLSRKQRSFFSNIKIDENDVRIKEQDSPAGRTVVPESFLNQVNKDGSPRQIDWDSHLYPKQEIIKSEK